MSKFIILKKRKDFLRAAANITMISHNVMLQAARPLSTKDTMQAARIGFTATKRLGKAHVRNRTKRRLRAAIREVYNQLALPNIDYVLVGRFSTATCPFEELLRDVKYTFKKINKQILAETETENAVMESGDNAQKNSDSAD